MEIEHENGTVERKEYENMQKLLADIPKVIKDKTVKKLIIYPAMRIPKKRK